MKLDLRAEHGISLSTCATRPTTKIDHRQRHFKLTILGEISGVHKDSISRWTLGCAFGMRGISSRAGRVKPFGNAAGCSMDQPKKSQLFKAVRRGDVAGLRELLATGEPVDAQD